MSFKELGLRNELLKTVEEEGYTSPTPIQKLAIPLVLEGIDLMAGAQTGTGKTAAFTLPLLHRLMQGHKNKPRIRALILSPTRELALQVGDNVKTYGKYLPLKSRVILGGVSINSQIHMLRKGVDILIATPGRLLDLMSRRALDLSSVEMLVLDEADRMLDMGFIHDIREIITSLPKSRQSLLFSATFSSEIKKLAAEFLNSPKMVEADQSNTTTELVSQLIYSVESRRKKDLLSFLISSNNWKQVLVFARTKHGTSRLAEQLNRDGIAATAIHGDKSQSARTKALQDFKRGIAQVLVATDVAARGIDIDSLPHVVNFDLPNVPENYVHRIGRTGRAGNQGAAISLVSSDERKLLRDIERLLQKKIPVATVPGFEPNIPVRQEQPPTEEPRAKKRVFSKKGRRHSFNKKKQARTPY